MNPGRDLTRFFAALHSRNCRRVFLLSTKSEFRGNALLWYSEANLFL